MMKIKDYTFAASEFHLKNIETLLPEDALLFDIETTGFQANYETIYLIGCGFRKGDVITIRLFFAPTPADEVEVLTAFKELLSSFHTLISYNGEGFDLPFVEKRFQRCGIESSPIASFIHLPSNFTQTESIDTPSTNLVSLDLYKVAKKYKSILNLEHYNQKTLEQYFGLFREDQYSGGELISIYKRQASHPSESDEATLFLHNMEDVKGMVTLLQLLEFERVLSPNPSDWKDLKLDVQKPTEILFTATMDYDTDWKLRITREHLFLQISGTVFSAILTPYAGTLKYFYPDYKNYVWIPDENLLLPKSLATTIDKSRQQKATRENCYAEKNGLFLPKILPSDEREFKQTCKDKQPYIEINPATLTPHYIADYILAAIK